MSRHFSQQRPGVGAALQANTYGCLVATFQFSSHVPLRGGANTGRHIYLGMKVPSGQQAGIFECAVNIRSDQNTSVLYTQRTEDLSISGQPDFGFQSGVKLAYGTGNEDGATFVGLHDNDFKNIENDDLYNQIADLSQNCDRVAVYGVTYSGGDGIHDVHMNSGTDAGDSHASQDRVHQDGAIAFYFDVEAAGQTGPFAQWIFIRFQSQSVVEA